MSYNEEKAKAREVERMEEAQIAAREGMRNDPTRSLMGSHNTPDRPRPEVPRELEQLQVKISAMINLVAELRERTMPVLSCALPTQGTSEKELAAPEVNSDMALTLRSRTEEVEEAIRIVRDIHERLEL